MVAPIIEVHDLSKSFGRVRALKDVSVSIPAGAVGLLGPNGAGKSTLIKILLGLLQADRGTGSVLDIDIRQSREVRRRVGYMPETECHIPGMDAVGYVTYCGQLSGMPYREAMKRAHLSLDHLGLDEARYRKVETYSAGMKQRLKLAQALVHDPDLIFLDEPTNTLDPEGRHELLLLVRELAHEVGISVIISTHILTDVEMTCDRVVVVHQGELVASDTLEALLGGGAGARRVTVRGNTERLLDALRQRGATAERMARRGDTALVEGGQQVLELTWDGPPPRAVNRAILELAQKTGCEVRGLEQTRRTLEDVFLELVGSPGSEA